jgi:hypothetical protein
MNCSSYGEVTNRPFELTHLINGMRGFGHKMIVHKSWNSAVIVNSLKGKVSRRCS